MSTDTPPNNPVNTPTPNPPAPQAAAQPASAPTPASAPQPTPQPAPAKLPKSAAAVAALVLSIVALLLSLLPIINNFAVILVVLAVVFGIIGIVSASKKTRSGLGIGIASLIIAIIAGAAILGSQAVYSAAIDEASTQLDRATGGATEEVLGTEVDVKPGNLKLKKSSYGLIESELPVTVTNLTDEQASFNIQIEALDAKGDRITQDYIYANDLGPGQSQTFKVFTYVSSDDYDAMKSATFNIVSAGVY